MPRIMLQTVCMVDVRSHAGAGLHCRGEVTWLIQGFPYCLSNCVSSCLSINMLNVLTVPILILHLHRQVLYKPGVFLYVLDGNPVLRRGMKNPPEQILARWCKLCVSWQAAENTT